MEGEVEDAVMYRCKKCRQIVATELTIKDHSRGAGGEAFSWKKRGKGDGSSKVACSSVFVDAMKWMNGIHDGEVEGKLQCVACQARLGTFNWAGMQCNCGAWVNPAFQLHKARLDLDFTTKSSLVGMAMASCAGFQRLGISSRELHVSAFCGARQLPNKRNASVSLFGRGVVKFGPVRALFQRKAAPKPVRETVIPEPDYRIPVVLLGAAGLLTYTDNLLPAAPLGFLGLLLLFQTTRVRFVFDDEALEVKVGSELQESGENVFVGGKNRWKYSTFINWELWWPDFPVLVYFKESQTKPEGQVHFFPVIFNGKQLYDVLVERAPKSN